MNKDEAISHLKHEIKNYLASGLAFLDLAQKKLGTEKDVKAAGYLGKVKTSLLKMNKFLDEFKG